MRIHLSGVVLALGVTMTLGYPALAGDTTTPLAASSLGAADAPPVFAPSVGDVLPGVVLVDLKDDATPAEEAAVAKEVGAPLHWNSAASESTDKLEVADLADPSLVEGVLARLRADPAVEHAEPMTVLRALFVPDDPLYASKQWHLKRVGAESAWDYTCGMGVTVAVVDTGVACFDKGPFTRGTDLGGTHCEGGWNFVDNSAEAYDDQGHGTHVAGTIAQTTNNGVGTAGLAYCATLMPVKVLNKSGWGTVANVAEGIRYAADHGAQIINMSLGGPIKSKVLEDAVNHAVSKGVIIVAAAGNSGKAVGYPAAYPGVIAVSATDSNDNIAWFSSRGPQIALAAPGVNVTQQTICDGGKNKCEMFGTFNGTSMASPHVAGVAAMVVGMGVTDPAAVRSTLESTARPKDDAKLYGAGIVDAAAAAHHVFWTHLVLRLLALGLLFGFVARRIKRRRGSVAKGPGVVAGAMLGAVGLLPIAPLLGLTSHAGPLRWLVELAMRPLGEWDLLLGAGAHRFMLLASAGPALLGAALFFASKRLRPALGGFALGAAALLAQVAFTADSAFVLGSVGLRIFAVANAAVCVWLARLALDRK